MTSRQPVAACIFVLLLGTLTCACASFSKEPPEKMRFLLEAQRENAESPAEARKLELRPFHAAVPFSASNFVYRGEGGSYSSDFYTEFFVAPGINIANVCRQWLRRSGLFASVDGGGSRMEPTHILEGDVIELFGDFSGQPARAVLKVRVVLLNGKDDSLVMVREYTLGEDVLDEKPASLVSGWNAALADFLRRLEGDLRLALGGS